MSRYTISLYKTISNGYYTREEIEGFFKDYNVSDYLTNEQIQVINEAGIWSKDNLARKIVDHYYMQEIGAETLGLFKLRCKVKMQEIMEEKLPLIYSAAIKYDPLVNVDYTETFVRNIDSESTSSGNANSTSNSNSSGLNINSDTPQGQINKTKILEGTYASSTSASESESNITNNTNTTGNSSVGTDENYEKRVKGNSGVSATAQKMVEQYRQNIISIDRDIIREISDLFMGVF